MARVASPSKNGRPLERYLPIAYFVAAIAAIVMLLPTVLRPPHSDPPSSAELSPDAPPQENQDSIIASFNKGTTGTAGAGEGIGAPAADGATGTGNSGSGGPGGPAPIPTLSRACPRGFGNPPRQTDSVYAPPCAAAFQGNNGGATWKGVTSNEVRIAVAGTTGKKITDGPVPDTPKGGASGMDRSISVIQRYFNTAYQTYGRTIRFVGVTPAGSSDTQQRSAAQTADDGNHAFAAGQYSEAFCQEMSRRQLVSFCPQSSADFYASHQPYLYGWYMDGTKLARFTAEYACKKLMNKPATFAGDPIIQGQQRKLGVIYYDIPNGSVPAKQFAEFLQQDCGVKPAISIGYTIDNGDPRLGQIIPQLRAAGVTTVVPFNDFTTLIAITNSSTSQGFFPEWLTNGFGAVDRNGIARVEDRQQWNHAFGFTALDMERPQSDMDCWRAYKSIDPNNNPEGDFCTYVYPTLTQVVAGIQMAGPTLNPTAFQQGLFKVGYRFYLHPIWAIGGGFGRGDLTYTDNVTEIWWNPDADDPVSGLQGIGAYEYVRGGKRFQLGQFPTEDPLVFSDGVTTSDDPAPEQYSSTGA